MKSVLIFSILKIVMKNFKIKLFLISLIVVCSCSDDFVNVESEDENSENFFNSEQDYQDALAKMATIFHAEQGTTEHEDAELLMALIEHYELKHFPINESNPSLQAM